MASSISKSLCLTCNKTEAFFTCRGCREDFCEEHINAHHPSPVKQQEDFLHDYQQFHERVVGYISEPRQHPLIEQIDKWERQSIKKIQQIAAESRTQILSVVTDHMISIKKSLENLSERFEDERNDEKLTERFLQQWRDLLEKLKNDFITPDTIQIRKDNDDLAFISKLVVNIVEPNDLFERSAGNIRIEDHGQVIIHSQWSDHSSVRGKNVYSSGQHRLRFKVEELDSDKWAFFGIISKNAPMKTISISTPTAYGLAGQNGICLNGIYQNSNDNGYESDMEINDKLQFLIDCDQQLICLTNERTHRFYRLNIDIEKCPFPWQLLLGLCCSAGDRIRILPCTYRE